MLVLRDLISNSTQLRVMELLKAMNMEVFKQYAIGTNVMMYKHPEDVRKYEGLIPSVGVLNLLNYALIETMVEIVCFTRGKLCLALVKRMKGSSFIETRPGVLMIKVLDLIFSLSFSPAKENFCY